MNYYIIIDDAIDEFRNYKDELVAAPFWNKKIAVSEHLFNQIELHKFIMIDNDDEEVKSEIENFENYFDKSVHLDQYLTVSEIHSQIIKCKLSAYFVPDKEETFPF